MEIVLNTMEAIPHTCPLLPTTSTIQSTSLQRRSLYSHMIVTGLSHDCHTLVYTGGHLYLYTFAYHTSQQKTHTLTHSYTRTHTPDQGQLIRSTLEAVLHNPLPLSSRMTPYTIPLRERKREVPLAPCVKVHHHPLFSQSFKKYFCCTIFYILLKFLFSHS